MITYQVFCFEFSKLVITYLIIKVVFELIRAIEDLILVIYKVVNRYLLRGNSLVNNNRKNNTPLRRFGPDVYIVYTDAKFETNEHEMCAICLCQKTDSVLQCGHRFHWECVNGWLDGNKTCPVCR